MALRKQNGEILSLTTPQDIKSKQGKQKNYKKAVVVVGWTETGKNDKEFNKQIAVEVFGSPENFNKQWNSLQNNYSVGDKVMVTFDINSNESGNNWFTSLRLINIEHLDKNVNNDKPQEGQVDVNDDDLPF